MADESEQALERTPEASHVDELDAQLGAVVRAEPVPADVAPAVPRAAANDAAEAYEPSVAREAATPAGVPAPAPLAEPPSEVEKTPAEPVERRARRKERTDASSGRRGLGIFVGCLLGGVLGVIAGVAYLASRREPDFTQWPTLLRQPDSLLEVAADPLIGGPAAAIVVVTILLGGLIGSRRRGRSRRA